MESIPSSRILSLQKKTPTHYLVKYTACQTYQIRTRGFFKTPEEVVIEHMSLHEVQYGTRKQIATAVVIGSGTEAEMVQLKCDKDRDEPTPLPTPTTSPTQSTTPTPTPSPPELPSRKRRRPLSKKSTKQKTKVAKPLATVISRGAPPSPSPSPSPRSSRGISEPSPRSPTPPPPASEPSPRSPSPPPPPAVPRTPPLAPRRQVQPTPTRVVPASPRNQPPSPTQGTPSTGAVPTTGRVLFPEDSRIPYVLDRLLRGYTLLHAQMTGTQVQLTAMERKMDNLTSLVQQLVQHQQPHMQPHQQPHQQHQPVIPAPDEDDDADPTNTIREERLIALRGKANSSGNFACLILKELQPHLYGPDHLRRLYNWHGNGEKQAIAQEVKDAVRRYTLRYYPGCRDSWQAVVASVNESLRRPAVKANRRR